MLNDISYDYIAVKAELLLTDFSYVRIKENVNLLTLISWKKIKNTSFVRFWVNLLSSQK